MGLESIYRDHVCVVGIGVTECPACGMLRDGHDCGICGHSDRPAPPPTPLPPPEPSKGKSVDSLYNQETGEYDRSICERCFTAKEDVDGVYCCRICGPEAPVQKPKVITPTAPKQAIEPDPACPKCRARVDSGEQSFGLIPVRILYGSMFVCDLCGDQQSYADALAEAQAPIALPPNGEPKTAFVPSVMPKAPAPPAAVASLGSPLPAIASAPVVPALEGAIAVTPEMAASMPHPTAGEVSEQPRKGKPKKGK